MCSVCGFSAVGGEEAIVVEGDVVEDADEQQ